MSRKNNESEKQGIIHAAGYKFIIIIYKLFITESLMWFGVNLVKHHINFMTYIYKFPLNETYSPLVYQNFHVFL